jgi:hypothetical protein
MWYAHNEYYSNDMLHSSPYDWAINNESWSGKKYGMDTENSARFFKRITLYTMSRQKYNSYTLWGPKIKSWKHGDLDYSDGSGLVENSMTIEFEGVSYGSGEVREGDLDGFASIHYDHIKSPLDLAGGGNADQVFDTANQSDPLASRPDFSENYFQAQVENGRIPLPEGSPQPRNINEFSNPNTVGGVIGASFPIDNNRDVETFAKPKQLNQNNQGNGFRAPTIDDL